MAVLPKGWASTITDLARQGKGPIHWMIALGITRNQYDTLCADSLKAKQEHDNKIFEFDKDNFSDIVRRAILIQSAYYEDHANRIINGGEGNAGMLKFIMCNKVEGYADRRTFEGNPEKPIEVKLKTMTREQLREEAAKRGLSTKLFDE